MTGGAVQQSRILKWLTSIITSYTKPLISSVASTKIVSNHTTQNIAKADSGATFHFLKPTHRKAMTDIVELKNGPKALLPNDQTIQASCEGHLSFDKISRHASKAFVYPDLSNESLLSIGQFCDDDCIAIFTKTNVYIVKDSNLVVEGFRNRADGLWDIKLPSVPTKWSRLSPSTPQINYIITKDKSKTELAQYLHATTFSPSLSTFTYAINNGNFVTWPGISELNFKKLIGTTVPIEKGHMDQERKNLRSTAQAEEHADFFPTQIRTKVYNLFASIESDVFTPKEKAYSDQTGRFPYKSTRGNQYIFTLYDYDGNTILAEPLKSLQGKVIAASFKNAMNTLQNMATLYNYLYWTTSAQMTSN